MTIGKKFGLICATLVAFTVGLAAASLFSIATLARNINVLKTDPIPGQYSVGRISSDFRDIGKKMQSVLLDFSGNSGKDMARLDKEVAEAQRKFQEEMKAYEGTITQDDDRRNFDALEQEYERCIRSWGRVRSLVQGGKPGEVMPVFRSETAAALDEAQRTVDNMVEWNKAWAFKVANQAEAAAKEARVLNWVVSAIAFLCGSLLAFFITRSVGRALRQIVAELLEGAEQVAGAAGEVSASSQSLAQGSSEQAASLEETSASSEEINSMARKNSENSRVAAELMAHSQQEFVHANLSLDQSVVAMGEINTQSDKISKIIKTIDEIAFQTNILALNAAVEAARAGEAGMGFAVVADEVRNLAQRCAQAAKDTAALIEESIAKSNDGKVKVDQVATAIRAITEEAAKVKTLVDEVNLGSEEQARGIDQIGKAITQMEQVTQKTAANAEESASAAEELNAQSETLKGIVERLTAMVGGGELSRGHGRRGRGRAMAAGGKQKKIAAAPVVAHEGKEGFPAEEQFQEF